MLVSAFPSTQQHTSRHASESHVWVKYKLWVAGGLYGFHRSLRVVAQECCEA